MSAGPVDVAVDGPVAVVTLNRPEVRNALDGSMVAGLGTAVTELDRDDEVSAIILTGAGSAFCAGFDLRGLAREPSGSNPPPMVPPDQLGLLPDHEKPIIGAVNGPAVTGGLELCLACDFLIASERARFADTHARVGAMPGSGLTVRLPELIGPDRARRMSFTGDFVDAHTAYDWGLVTEVVPHDGLLGRARELAVAIASIPPANVAALRRTYAEIAGLSGPEAWHRENALAREWIATRFDRGRLETEREAIVEPGSPSDVKVYAGMDPRLSLTDVAAHARRVEALGYDGLHVPETVHDALAVSLLALTHTERLTVRTAVALAFVRSPTLTAYSAWDLAIVSGGRFELGLGTQIRQNIEDRYAVAWDDPVGRLRDYVEALRALFDAFGTGGSVDHRGPHYRLTRLQPYFNPGPDRATPPPPVWLGGVNPKVCELAGELADGFVTHPTNSTPRYLEERCLPHLSAGARRAGRTVEAVPVVAGGLVVTGRDRGALDAERERVRRLFAFLYSTPAYRPTLDLYGWGDLGPRLRTVVREGRWDDLAELVSEEVLETVTTVAPFDTLAGALLARYAGLANGILVPVPADPADDDRFAEVLGALRTERP